MSKYTILIVDDAPANLDLLFRHLSQNNYRVLIATDGQTALDRAIRTQPDLILLDVMMPGMDGYETCRHLKAEPRTHHIPVLFMTALDDVHSKVTGFKVGGVDYLTKPIELDEVEARVNNHLTLRNLQRDLERNNKLLREKNEELDTFAHTVAHDIKNQLGLITGYADYLHTDTRLHPELKGQVEAILKNSIKMNNIIDELQILAGVRKMDVTLTPLPMGDIIAAAMQRLSQLIFDYGATIIIPDAWPTSIGYAPWIEEVWVNYLSNGIKYGGRPPRLELGATDSDGWVEFWVKDDGMGLTAAEQARLFKPFTRMTDLRIEGQGLGLSIVQRIMDKLGGRSGVESHVGAGSRFYFMLPKHAKLIIQQKTEEA